LDADTQMCTEGHIPSGTPTPYLISQVCDNVVLHDQTGESLRSFDKVIVLTKY
jgi:hypothetical protein